MIFLSSVSHNIPLLKRLKKTIETINTSTGYHNNPSIRILRRIVNRPVIYKRCTTPHPHCCPVSHIVDAAERR